MGKRRIYFCCFTVLLCNDNPERVCEYKKDEEYIQYLEETQKAFGEKVQELCWDNDRFIRGYTEAGERIGEAAAPEANMWLNPQSWAVISGLATPEQGDAALNNVYERLNTEYGAILMDPPYHAHAFDGALAVIYNQGTKEKSGIFSQSQGWLILAEALAVMENVLLPILWKILLLRRMTVPKSVVLSHTAMVSSQREKQANTLDALMFTG